MDEQLDSQLADFHPVTPYSPAPVFDDDTFVDVSDAAREAGLGFPVALTRDAWNLCVALTPAAERAGCDEHGRLLHVLSMLEWAVGRAGARCPVSFEVPCITHSVRPTCIPLRAVAGAHDDAEPAVTLMLPEES
jgi:hypothetical protein